MIATEKVGHLHVDVIFFLFFFMLDVIISSGDMAGRVYMIATEQGGHLPLSHMSICKGIYDSNREKVGHLHICPRDV